MSSAYRIASPFLIRLAGVPFDVLEELATPNACAAARDLLAQEKELHQLKSAALEFVTRRDSGLSSEEFAAWRTAIRRDKIPEQKIPQPLQEYARVATAAGQARSHLEHQLLTAAASFRLATVAPANVNVTFCCTSSVSRPRTIHLANSVLRLGVRPVKLVPR